jgi:hypothetical protein
VAGRIEQRDRLRREEPLPDTAMVLRGGRDSVDKLRRHALLTARAWSLDGAPLFGISVFAVVDQPLEALLRERFASFRTMHVTTVGRLRGAGFALLPTGLRPHFTIRLSASGEAELRQLLAVLGLARDNAQYGQSATWREEAWNVSRGHRRGPQR